MLGFKLGICNCGCGDNIPIRSLNHHIQRFIKGHKTFLGRHTNNSRTGRSRAVSILRRNGKNRCEINNKDCSKKRLETHHIDGNPLNNDIKNLAPLCIIHHRIIENRKISLNVLKRLKLEYRIDKNGKRRYKFRTRPVSKKEFK